MKLKKDWMLIFLVIGMTFLVACGGTAESSAEGENIVIDVSLPLGEDSHHGIGVLTFGEELEKLSDGRIKIKPHYDNALGGEREVFEGMGVGTIDAGIISTGPMGGFVDEFLLFDLPYIFENHDHVYAFLDSEYGDELGQLVEEKANVKVLAWMENGFRHNTNSVRAIEKPEDFKGIDHRTQESQVQIDTWTAIGANATPMAWTEVYTGLQQGVIDSQENPLPTIYDVNFFEVQDYLNLTKHVYHPAPLLMSKSKFDSFSEEDQQLVLEAAANALPVQREASQKQEQELVIELENKGMEVSEPDLEAFNAIVQPVIEKWKPTIGEDLVDAALNFEF